MTCELLPIVVYHKNCLDGFGAALAAFLSYKEEAEYVALDYHERAAFMARTDLNHRDIIILDFSFSKEDTDRLQQICGDFIWLDHHKSAFEEHGLKDFFDQQEDYQVGETVSTEDYNYVTHIHLSPNKNSGAYMAWKFFQPFEPVPALICYIQDRDLWQFLLHDTKKVCLALSQLPQDFHVWASYLNDLAVIKLYRKGCVINEYYNTQLKNALDSTRESCIILGHKGLCANLPPMFSSEAGNILAKESGTFGATWFKDKQGNIKWSLRSIGDYDVSIIAREFGGGGHKNAAGFVLHPESGLTQSGVQLFNFAPQQND